MNLNILARTLDVAGKLMVAYTAIAVHHRVRKDHKIDKDVIKIAGAEAGIEPILLDKPQEGDE